jgi:hypothetical protein
MGKSRAGWRAGGRERESLQTCMSRILTGLDRLLASIATYLHIYIKQSENEVNKRLCEKHICLVSKQRQNLNHINQ